MNRPENLEAFQAQWEKMVEKGFYHYETLSPQERVWFNVQSIVGLGIWDHYMNSGAEHNADTIADFRTLGLPHIAALFERMNTLFGGTPPADIDERSDIIEAWEDGLHNDFIEDIEDEYFEKDNEVEQTLIDFIMEHKLYAIS